MDTLSDLLLRPRGDRRAAIMGVLNVTPDSFYDGGRFLVNSAVRDRVTQLVSQGADIIDIGAESSRPGAAPIPAAIQLERLDFALGCALEARLPVSIDTTDPEVADACLQRGAQLINDVSCLRDPALAEVAARHGCWLILMHSRAPMSEMKGYSVWPDDDYADIVEDVACEWGRARDQAVRMGVMPSKIIFDPGFAFSKNARHSYEVLRRLGEFKRMGAPILAGVSRKSFLAWEDQSPPAERLGGSIAGAVLALQQGVDVLRVHDVQETRQAEAVLRATNHPKSALLNRN